MSRRYVCVSDEEYVLDQWEAFSHSCMAVISFHSKVQSSIGHLVCFFWNSIVSGETCWRPCQKYKCTYLTLLRIFSYFFFQAAFYKEFQSRDESKILLFNFPRGEPQIEIEPQSWSYITLRATCQATCLIWAHFCVHLSIPASVGWVAQSFLVRSSRQGGISFFFFGSFSSAFSFFWNPSAPPFPFFVVIFF